MKLAALALLLLAALSAGENKTRTTIIVKDYKDKHALVQPIYTAKFGVEVEGAPLSKGEVLHCEVTSRTTKISVEGQAGNLIQTVLLCGDEKNPLAIKELFLE